MKNISAYVQTCGRVFRCVDVPESWNVNFFRLTEESFSFHSKKRERGVCTRAKLPWERPKLLCDCNQDI